MRSPCQVIGAPFLLATAGLYGLSLAIALACGAPRDAAPAPAAAASVILAGEREPAPPPDGGPPVESTISVRQP